MGNNSRKVKCAWCKEYGSKEEMSVIQKGHNRKSYYHTGSCYDSYIKDKKFKENEVKQWQELYEYVKNLHSFEILDTRMIKKLQDLRNGTLTVNSKQIKKYKQGVPYNIILTAYKLESPKIQWAIKNKRFENDYNQFAYCFAIMESGVNRAAELEKQSQLHIKLQNKIVNHDEQIIDIPQKREQKDELDISDFL